MNPLRLPSIMTDLRSHAAVATETITVCTMLSTISKSRNFSRAHPSSRVNKSIFYEFSTDNKKSRTHFFPWKPHNHATTMLETTVTWQFFNQSKWVSTFTQKSGFIKWNEGLLGQIELFWAYTHSNDKVQSSFISDELLPSMTLYIWWRNYHSHP